MNYILFRGKRTSFQFTKIYKISISDLNLLFFWHKAKVDGGFWGELTYVSGANLFSAHTGAGGQIYSQIVEKPPLTLF